MQASILGAQKNWEGCGRKGIRHKNGGDDGGGVLISPDGVASSQIVSASASAQRLHVHAQVYMFSDIHSIISTILKYIP